MSQTLTLPLALQTPSDLGKIILELRAYLGKLRDQAVRKKVAGVTNEVAPELSPLTLALLEANGLKLTESSEIEVLLRNVEALRTKAPVARLTLADLPDNAQKQQFAGWFRSSVHPHALLTFSARSDLGGGFILQAGSKRYDFSFRAQLLANKQKIAEIVARGK